MNEQERVWLDRLLSFDQSEQGRELQRLANTQPELHARLAELLANAAANSREFMQPVLRALDQVVQSGMVVHEPGSSLAGYRLLREIGRGGMSVVWLAERMDGVIKRTVALKLPLYTLGSAADVARFAREKDVLAALTHPNIARLYDAGVSDSGQPFLVLEYVEGLPITAYCDQHRLSIPRRLQLFLQALAAVEAAHRHLIVHLDLKPSNILVDSQGDVKLLDFGISRLLGEAAPAPDSSSTLPREVHVTSMAMTALYAAPEQALGLALSTQTDVYALGVLLHELITGLSPYMQADGVQCARALLERVKHGVAVRPSAASFDDVAAAMRALPDARRLRAALRGDLDAIVHRAMQLEPVDRYGSVERLAADLQRFLDNMPVEARSPSLLHSVQLFMRRHRAACLTAGAGLLLSLMVTAWGAREYQNSRASRALSLATVEFLFDMVNDAEPDETQGNKEITGKQIIDAAVRRVHRKFFQQPQLLGELLTELGRMYARLGEISSAERVLVQATDTLAARGEDDPALNRARALRANLMLYRGDLPNARKLASEVRRRCVQRDIACAKARIPALETLATIFRMDGDVDASLSVMHESIADIELASGKESLEVAEALSRMAIVERNADRFVPASATIRRALELSRSATLRKQDRIQMLRTDAIIQFDMGHYDQARSSLQELLAETQDPDEVSLQMRLLANVHLAEGNPSKALELADAVIARAATPLDEQVLFARQTRAQAQAALGARAAALVEIQGVIDGLPAAGHSPDSAQVLRALRVRGEILLRGGDARQARSALQAVLARWAALPHLSLLEYAQTLDLLGCAERELGLTEAAVNRHAEARAVFEKILPPDHPFFLRNTLYHLVATGSWGEFKLLSASTPLAVNSKWRELLETPVKPSICSVAAGCVFVLW